MFILREEWGGGGGGTPSNGVLGKAPPERGTCFSGFRYMKGLGFPYLKYIKEQKNLSYRSNRPENGVTDALCGDEKVKKTFWFFIYLSCKYCAFTAVKRDKRS